MAMMTRDQFVESKGGIWAAIGGTCKKAREFYGISAGVVAKGIGVSVSTLRRFENGKPIRSAQVIEKAYAMFIMLNSAREQGFTIDSLPIQYTPPEPQIKIVWNETGDDSLILSRPDGEEIARINTGDYDLDCALAIDMCEKMGEAYYFAY
ncbi:helix-turn-helix domain-containing protein [Paenibacillus vini]|uniref:HTH cro/C1-type domain-containing protein n=1 Tax=Paenibacillus vini TaxID=1476024 RepID=A0ABQ4MFM7_9BACL|nr:helix-turn-helix transcriptional regulator [Paenibacillus vini]GIP54744.1 hypothetical protein J42TS3_37790 [Paenibacillus vini]